MKLPKIAMKPALKAFEKWVKQNAPTILMSTGIACFTGAIITAVPATIKSTREVDAENAKRAEGETIYYDNDPSVVVTPPLTKKEVIKMAWKHYIPTAALFVGGTMLVITANHMQLLRLEALTAAYAMNSKRFDEYKDKVKALYGNDGEKKVDQAVSAEHAAAPGFVPAMPGDGSMQGAILCRDSFTGQMFWSTRALIDKVLYELDHDLQVDSRVSVNDLLYKLGCHNAQYGESYGWDTDEDGIRRVGTINLMEEIRRNYAKGPDGQPVLVLEYEPRPFR